MRIILTIIALACFSSVAQINPKKLIKELDEFYIKIEAKSGWKEYLNNDSLLEYYVHYNSEEEITNGHWGIAVYVYKYNSKGLEIEYRCYDENGKLFYNGDWPPIHKTEYNERGLVSRVDYFDVDEKPVKNVARIEYKYDENDEVINDRYYNENYQLEGEGCITRYEYNNERNIVTEANYSPEGEISTQYGYAYSVIEYKTSERDTLIQIQYLNENRELVMIKDSHSDIEYAVIRYTLDLKNNKSKMEKLDLNSKVVWEMERDLPPKEN